MYVCQVDYLRNYEKPNPRTYIRSKPYAFEKGTTKIFSESIRQLPPLKSLVEISGDVQAMEE